jgi:hypothetical protein
MQTDGGTRPTFPTRSTHGRRERRDPELTKLADDRVPALALTTRVNLTRRITQMRASSHRRMRDPLGGHQPPTPPVLRRVCG